MSESLKLPPDPMGQSYTQREQAMKNCIFFPLRKAATEGVKITQPDGTVVTGYVHPDGKPFCDYNDTINDRSVVRTRLLDYELAQGWIVDDRTTQVAAQMTVEAVPQPVAAPVAPPPQVVTQVQAAPQAPSIPQPQPPPMESNAPLGKKRPGPRLTAAVAPPVAAPVAPPTAQVIKAPEPAPAMMVAPAPLPATVPTFQAQVVMFPAAVEAAPLPAPALAPLPVAAPSQVAAQDIAISGSQLTKKLDAIGMGLQDVSKDLEFHKKDFSQFVGNLSEQINSQNKSLTSLEATLKETQRTVELMMGAIHHLYLYNPAVGAAAVEAKATTAPAFKEYLAKFVPRP